MRSFICNVKSFSRFLHHPDVCFQCVLQLLYFGHNCPFGCVHLVLALFRMRQHIQYNECDSLIEFLYHKVIRIRLTKGMIGLDMLIEITITLWFVFHNYYTDPILIHLLLCHGLFSSDFPYIHQSPISHHILNIQLLPNWGFLQYLLQHLLLLVEMFWSFVKFLVR